MDAIFRFLKLGSIYLFKASVLGLLTAAFFANYQLKIQHQKSTNEETTIIEFIKGDGIFLLSVFAIIIVVFMIYKDFQLENRRSQERKDIEFYKSLTNSELTDETRKMLIKEYKDKD